MTTQEDTQPLERRVRRLEDAHAAMEKSIGALGTQMALSEQEQRHMRELMDTRFTGVETLIAGVAGKVDALTAVIQTQSTDPSGSVINREVNARLADLEATTVAHGDLIQRGIGAGHLFKGLALGLGAIGAFTGVLSFLHTMGVIR